MGATTKWLIAALLAALTLAGWLGWREHQWREAYYADVVGQLTYQVEMAHRQMVRAAESHDRTEQVEALSSASSYLNSAMDNSLTLVEYIQPTRKGRVVWMPKHYVPSLLQYARSLTPDLPDQALQRRIELVSGLEQALKAGITDQRAPQGLSRVVDLDRLKQSLDDYFEPMEPDPPRTLQFADDWNQPAASATQRGSEVVLYVDWSHAFRLFPLDSPAYTVLVRPGAGVTVSSDAGLQHRMGTGTFEPFTVKEIDADLHAAIRALPAGWAPGTYTAISIPEGLAQTLTLHLPEGAKPDLLLIRGLTGEQAVAIPVE